MVHEKLYQSEALSSIQMDDYVDQLTDYISGIYVDEQHTDIEIRNKAEPIALEIRQAIPCGLILNELITNSFKHAFNGTKGVLEIELYKEDDTVCMQVCDNGSGLPEGVDFEASASLGSTLVQTLVNQLNAELEIDSGPEGTTIGIRFELKEREAMDDGDE